MKIANLDLMKQVNPSLHHLLQHYVKDGQVADNLPIDIKDRVDAWVAAHPPEPEIKDTHAEDIRRLIDAENKRVRRQRDEKAGFARLQQYVDEQGLADTEQNIALVQAWLDEKAKGYWSAGNVDAVIAVLRTCLQWGLKPKATPVAAPPTPAEPVELLSDGSPRLPTDAVPSHAHTKEQLRDLSHRRREGQHTARFGRFTSRF